MQNYFDEDFSAIDARFLEEDFRPVDVDVGLDVCFFDECPEERLDTLLSF